MTSAPGRARPRMLYTPVGTLGTGGAGDAISLGIRCDSDFEWAWRVFGCDWDFECDCEADFECACEMVVDEGFGEPVLGVGLDEPVLGFGCELVVRWDCPLVLGFIGCEPTLGDCDPD